MQPGHERQDRSTLSDGNRQRRQDDRQLLTQHASGARKNQVTEVTLVTQRRKRGFLRVSRRSGRKPRSNRRGYHGYHRDRKGNPVTLVVHVAAIGKAAERLVVTAVAEVTRRSSSASKNGRTSRVGADVARNINLAGDAEISPDLHPWTVHLEPAALRLTVLADGSAGTAGWSFATLSRTREAADPRITPTRYAKAANSPNPGRRHQRANALG
jgi:hypothetical protein